MSDTQDVNYIKIFIQLTQLLGEGKSKEWLNLFKSIPQPLQEAYAKMPIKQYAPDLAKKFESEMNINAIANNETVKDGGVSVDV